MRFRRKKKLFPGVYLNFSKTGISTTFGIPGASVNFNKQGTFLNTGIPGTGIYDRHKINIKSNKEKRGSLLNSGQSSETYNSQEVVEIKTVDVESTTTEGLRELKKTLHECYLERNNLKIEIVNAKAKFKQASILLIISNVFLFGFFIKWFRENKIEKKDLIEYLNVQLESCFVNIAIDIEHQLKKKFLNLIEAYKTLITCENIWDITSTVIINQKTTRSAAKTGVTRRLVKFDFGNIDIIKSKYDALHFENANGGDIYIYPAFIVIVDSTKKFGLIDIRELDFNFNSQRFIESEKIAEDATVVGNTWAKVNKDGSQDRRFKDNYQVPICDYGEISLTTTSGLNEAYLMSSFDKSEKFADAMIEYQKLI